MKVYNTKLDEYGWAIESGDYIKDKRIPFGTKGEVLLEMKIWNIIARIVNFLFKRKEVYVCPDFPIYGVTKEARKIIREKPIKRINEKKFVKLANKVKKIWDEEGKNELHKTK